MISRRGLLPGLLALSVSLPLFAADIEIVNLDGAGEGFNDDTPRQPVGGNPGETLGEQRLIALQYAADILGRRIASTVRILVGARFDSQGCTVTNATLASAGSNQLAVNFPGAKKSDTFYPIALANSLAGRDLDRDGRDITTTFNSDLDDPLRVDCLGGADWYYGLDQQPPEGDVDFLAVATHELVHGVGFETFTDLLTGAFPSGRDEEGRAVGPFPDIYAFHIRDLRIGLTWPEMTREQRQDSANNGPDVVWNGPGTTSTGAPTLTDGTNMGQVQLYAPLLLSEGSSISHWDTAVEPDALMEPFVNPEAPAPVLDGIGLSACLLEDIGWMLINDARCPDQDSAAPPLPDGVAESVPTSGGGGGGGGGCSLAGPGAADPLWPALLLLALAGIAWRARRRG